MGTPSAMTLRWKGRWVRVRTLWSRGNHWIAVRHLLVARFARSSLTASQRDEAVEGDVFRNGSKPELRGLLLLSWPFDQEPFLIPGNDSIEVPVRGANTDTREARDQDVGAAFAPGNHLPGLGPTGK